MLNLRNAIATAVIGAAIVSMAGCTGGALPGVVAGIGAATGGTSGAPSSGGAACATTTGGPAAAPTTGTPAEGNYSGLTLPNGWDTAYKTQAEVDGGFTNLSTGDAGTWAKAQCLYQPAIAKWHTNTGK